MKKVKKSLLSLMLLFVLSAFIFIGCSKENFDEEGQNESFIDLTIDNYDYYLNLDSQFQESYVFAGGSIRISTYKMVITGALNAIYENCILSYKIGDEGSVQSVKLNISGFATFNYSTRNGARLEIVDVEGLIFY